MPNKVSFSGQHPSIYYIREYHSDITNSITYYYKTPCPNLPPKYVGYTYAEFEKEYQERLHEHEIRSILAILSATEALFRIDYLQRCYKKRKDDLSRYFRSIHKVDGSRVSFEEKILDGWKEYSTADPQLIGELRSAFKFRHWVAHGRYWSPKLGRKFDYKDVSHLIDLIASSFPFIQ